MAAHGLGEPRDHAPAEARDNVFLTVPRDHASVGVPRPGGRTFNAVRLPEGTVVGGRDVGGFEVFPGFVNASPRGEGFAEVPLLRGREVWLQRQVFGPDGQFAIDANGHRARETVRADPAELAAAVDRALGRSGCRDGACAAGADRAAGPLPLSERAGSARRASAAMERGAPRPRGAERGLA